MENKSDAFVLLNYLHEARDNNRMINIEDILSSIKLNDFSSRYDFLKKLEGKEFIEFYKNPFMARILPNGQDYLVELLNRKETIDITKKAFNWTKGNTIVAILTGLSYLFLANEIRLNKIDIQSQNLYIRKQEDKIRTLTKRLSLQKEILSRKSTDVDKKDNVKKKESKGSL